MNTPMPAKQHPVLKPFYDDHTLIKQGLGVLQAMSEAVRSGRPPAGQDVLALVDFFRGFGDGCHHDKEDTALVPVLKAAGLVRPGTPVAAMMDEHRRLRELMSALESAMPYLASSPEAQKKFTDGARAYGDLLATHMTAEETVVFPAAAVNLGSEGLAAVQASLDLHLASPAHQGSHLRLRNGLERLLGTYRRGS